MIAADTSVLSDFIRGLEGDDLDFLSRAIQNRQLLMIPVVLTELLSSPSLGARASRVFSEIPKAEISEGYWERAGALRAKVVAKKRKARLGDALIAQCCIDNDLPLLTRDADFRAFSEAAGLSLIVNI